MIWLFGIVVMILTLLVIDQGHWLMRTTKQMSDLVDALLREKMRNDAFYAAVADTFKMIDRKFDELNISEAVKEEFERRMH